MKTWYGVEPEAPTGCIRKESEEAIDFAPSLLVAFGGGSALDCSEANWILYERSDLESRGKA